MRRSAISRRGNRSLVPSSVGGLAAPSEAARPAEPTYSPSRRPPDPDSIGTCWSRALCSSLSKCGLPSGAVGDGVQQPPGVVHVIRVGRRDQLPARTGPGRLPKHRASSGAIPCGRRGGRPGSCRTTCGRPAPGARHSRSDRSRGPCSCTGRAPGRAGRSWAGCRSGASSRTAASTAGTAAPRPAGPHARAGRRCRRWWQSPICLVRYLVR